MPNKKSSIIANRVFSLSDQINFATFSGDFNPIHVDPVFARRSLTGGCTVHGLHALLWALEALMNREVIRYSAIDVDFLKPIFLNEKVTCIWDESTNIITLVADDVILISCKLFIDISDKIFDSADNLEYNFDELRDKVSVNELHNLSFDEASQMQKQPFRVSGQPKLSLDFFPELTKNVGSNLVCEIAAISKVVGMECPGLNSLFATLKLQLLSIIKDKQEFSVTKSNPRFNYIELSLKGKSLQASAGIFYRPPKIIGISPKDCMKYINKKEFLNVKALIIGGTRGLGELVAKLIISGGGQAVITYHLGKEDADAIVEELKEADGKCSTIQYSVGTSALNFTNLSTFNQVYYFATPKIASKRKRKKDLKLEEKFLEFYVNEFSKICNLLHSKGSEASIFYPSTNLIDYPETGFEEYIYAKQQGEKICNVLNKKNLKIIYKRLPRMNTDQNISLIKLNISNEISVMLPVIRSMIHDF